MLHPFHDLGYYHDPHAEGRRRAARSRAVRELARAERLQRWADRSARLAGMLSKRARMRRARAY